MSQSTAKAAAADASASAALRARSEVARLISYIVIGSGAAFLSLRASTLPTSRWEPLGAGSFPELVFGVLAVLCLTAAVRAVIDIRKAGGANRLGTSFAKWLVARRYSFALFGLLVVYLALLPLGGFSLTTFVFLLIAQLMIAGISKKTLIQSLIAAMIFSVGLNMLFAEVFNVFLPRGVLFAG
ncbi:tripartite tricarboxylate transporter TctB family protein [Thalassospira sp. HF15]|uniref:tripartite tricarboxylate transporter TctB family protein n=1 Tax=Thalassospira sp. HF15 TaxID=2722755 RepID=UPI001430531B|nr:tripartite tricarboxylate transporter TctB family protein [Thalassospira sp. HF15]NIY75209.1 tripartite tricarboxylate transporter TctB family protein [Thalassospira sp. HF15]